MKKLLVSAGIAGLLFGGAGTAIARSDSPNACFGQQRSLSGQAGTVGEEASARKGDNASINHDFMTGGYGGICPTHSGNPGGK
jgi:hypothetical protein